MLLPVLVILVSVGLAKLWRTRGPGGESIAAGLGASAVLAALLTFGLLG